MLAAVSHLLVIACIAQHQRAVRCVDVALAAVFAHALDAVAVAQPASVGAVGVWCAHVVLQCVDQTAALCHKAVVCGLALPAFAAPDQ